jgi:hypothetical protein
LIKLSLSIDIVKFPVLNSISTWLDEKLCIKPANAVAQAAVPQALVKPAPRSHTLTFINFSFITCAIVTLHLSGNSS